MDWEAHQNFSMKDGVIDEKGFEPSEGNESSRADETSREEVESIGEAVEPRDEETGNDLSRTHSKKSEIDPFGEPPDGGLNAWLKVLGCFLIYSNIWYAFSS